MDGHVAEEGDAVEGFKYIHPSTEEFSVSGELCFHWHIIVRCG